MAAPTYVSTYSVAASTTNAAKTTASFNATAGDVLVAACFAESSTTGDKPGAISNTQGALTWTLRCEYNTSSNANNAYVKVWTAVVDANKTGMTVSVADNSNSNKYWGMNVVHFTGSDGVGNVVTGNSGTTSTAPSQALTTSGDNSALVMNIADWTASNAARTYRTINGSGATERYYSVNTALAMGLSATWADAGTAGSKTLGLTSPSMRWVMGGVEVLGTTGGGQTVDLQAITASSTLYNPTIINTQEIVFNVLNVTSTILSPSVIQDVAFNVITTTSTIFSPSVVPDIVATLITTSSTLLNPTITPGAVSVVTPLIATTGIVLDPGSEMILQLAVTNTTSTIFSPSLDYNVVLNVLNTTSTVLQTLLATNADLQVLNTTSTVYAPELNQDINIPVLSAPESVLTPNVLAAGSVLIDMQLVGDDSTIFAPTTFTTINVPVVNAPSSVQSPSLKYEIRLQVVSTSSTIFTPSLEYLIEMQTVNTAPTILAPRIGEAPPDTGQGGIVKTNSPSPFPIGI